MTGKGIERATLAGFSLAVVCVSTAATFTLVGTPTGSGSTPPVVAEWDEPLDWTYVGIPGGSEPYPSSGLDDAKVPELLPSLTSGGCDDLASDFRWELDLVDETIGDLSIFDNTWFLGSTGETVTCEKLHIDGGKCGVTIELSKAKIKAE